MKKYVFVLMPFSPEFDDIYRLGIKPACLELEVYCERVDEQYYEGSILDRIYNQIAHADYIIADMSKRNPNVFYEVGYAHALGKRVILVTQKSDDIPFDMKHFAHIIYNAKITLLKDEIQKRLKWYLEQETISDSLTQSSLNFYINGLKLDEEKDIYIECLAMKKKHWDEKNIQWESKISLSCYNDSTVVYREFRNHISLVVPYNMPIEFGSHNSFMMPDDRITIPDLIYSDLNPGQWAGKSLEFNFSNENTFNSSYDCFVDHNQGFLIKKYKFTIKFVLI